MIEAPYDYLAMDAGEMLDTIGTDARRWADAFMQHAVTDSPLGKALRAFPDGDAQDALGGNMLGWFANAIEAGRTAGSAATASGDSLGYNAEQNYRENALRMAHAANPGARESVVLGRAATYANFIISGEGAPDLVNGPITRAEIGRRGFDEAEGAHETLLGVFHKLGWPSRDAPLGTDPTHELAPVGAIDMLAECQAQFVKYAQSHRAKCTPEADEKAEVNEALAARITALLADEDVPGGGFMVGGARCGSIPE